MRCKKVKKILSDHLEKTIPAVEEHLKICPECRREMEGIKAAEDKLRSVLGSSDEKPSGLFEANLLRRLREEGTKKPFWLRIPLPHLEPRWALLAVPVIALLIFFLVPHRVSPPAEEPILSYEYGEDIYDSFAEKDPELFYKGAIEYVLEKGEPLAVLEALGEDWTALAEALTYEEGQMLIDSLKKKWEVKT